MRRFISLFLAIIMIWGTTAEVFAVHSSENMSKIEGKQMDMSGNFGNSNIMPTSIKPSSEKRHEYRFYSSKEEAEGVRKGTIGQDNPFDTKLVRTDGILEEIELVEKKDELFEGWFYTEDDGVEKKVPFGKQRWIGENKTLYAYPKRSKVIAVFFSHGSVVHKSASPDANGMVSINEQPGVGEAGKVLKGWSIEESFSTVAEAKAAGKLFHFKEEAEPTLVTGTLMLHAIFENSIRVTFDTNGSKIIPGVDIEAGDRVEVPDSTGIEKEGYTFQYWYVLEENDDSPNGYEEVRLNSTTIGGVNYFDYTFTKDTIVNAKWKGKIVPFNIVFMAEKRPDQIRPGGEKYAFLGSFNNMTNSNLQITQGIAGSQIIFDDDTSASPSKVTSLDKDQFKSYLKEDNNTKNLLKYADLMQGVNKDSLKGFHVNKEETNKKNPIIEGNGLTTKVVYLDRDTVNLKVFKEGHVDDETTNPDALGGFKYGQILLENNENRGWNYLFKTYIKVGNNWRWLGNYEPKSTRSYFSIPPFAVEKVSNGGHTAKYMKKSGDAWVFEFYDADTLNGEYIVLSLPIRLPADQQTLTYNQSLNWIKIESEENLRNYLLPNSKTPLIGRMGGMPDWMYVQAEDYPLINGYTTINAGQTYGITDLVSIKKLKSIAGVEESDTSSYKVMPIIYKKQNFVLQFDSKATGDLSSEKISGIPYNCTIVNPENPGEGDPNIPEKEEKVKNYLAKFTKAIVDEETKEVTNLDIVTKNQDGHLFMGWYLDPGYTIPFDEHMPMPAQNLQVFAKWEPLYHYITVHHLPAGTNGVNKPENITELKVAHNGLINAQEDILKNPPILEGRSRADFQGWETYGDVIKEEPSVSGVEGGPFLYKFDKKVVKGFHLYPRWYSNKVGVVYAFNYDESDIPLKEDKEIDKIMKNLDKSDKPLLEKNRYYMSEYKYPLDSKVRLRAPFGWNDQGMIREPKAPEGTEAHGKVFLGWKIMYRDKLAPFAWHTIDNLVYYNSEVEFTENNISHRSDAKKGDAIGVMVLVAQWGERKLDTKLTLHRNDGGNDPTKEKEYEIKSLNAGWTLPDLDAEGLTGFKRDKYQFLGWNENPDGSGKMYKPGKSIFIDETHDTHLNHLYAQWEKYYTLEATKKWKPKDKTDYNFKMGLLRYTAPSASNDPSFSGDIRYQSVKGSLKTYKTDLENGKMKWEVPGLDENGNRYSYIIVEVTPEMENAFNNFKYWGDLGVTISARFKSKTQIIELKDPTNKNKVDTFSSATVRSDKIENGKIVGYVFTVTNEKIEVPKPIITQPYANEKVILITPGKDLANQVKTIEVNLGNGETLKLTKDADTGHFTVSNNPAYKVTADPSGKLTIKLPDGKKLEKNQVITAVAKDADKVSSETDSKTVLDAKDSFKIDKPVQGKRDSDYNVLIKANIPQGTTVVDDTSFTLVDDNGNIIKNGQTPITGTLDKDGHTVVFKVADGILTDGQKVKVQTEEPGKKPILSDLSEALDINAPEITAENITGTVNVNLGIDANVVTVTDKDLTNLEFKHENLPAALTLTKVDNESKWKIGGAGKYVIEAKENYQVTYTAIDRFGNKATKTVQVTITDKAVVGSPTIDDMAKGDTSVTITPPTNGDTLVVTFPSGEVTLTKDGDNWTDGNNTYKPDGDDKINVPVPDNGTLNVGDIVTAQGKDSTGTLADSPKVVKSVGQSSKKTPTPQFKKITVGDENFKIRPVDQTTESIITDKLVITIRKAEGVEEKKITLKKKDTVWVRVMDNGSEKALEMDGEYIIVALEGIALTAQHSFGATGEDTFHGHAISDPTSINVNAEQSKKPKANQGENKENGNPTIKGEGEPGSYINVYDPETGDLIAGPVKVDKDGNYEIEVPKDALPEDGVVDVKQKEDGKPESEAEKVTIDKTGPTAPEIDQPNIGDTNIKVKPPVGAEKMIITMPDGSKVELRKKDDGTWTDGTDDFPMEDGKISLPTEPLKNNDVIKAIAKDEFGNTSPEDSKTVGNEDSFVTGKPEQKPRNENGDVVIESKIPEGSNPADGTTYTLLDEEGNPIMGADGKPITATPDQDGKLTFNVPEGTLKDGQKVKVKTKEPGKKPTITEASESLDLTGPVITASNITGKVGVAIEEATISTNEAADITVSPNLPNSLVLGDANQDKTKWKINGKGEYVTTTTHTVVAVDKFGNKTEATFTVTITNKDAVDEPQIDTISQGDTSVKITPPTNGDTLVVTFPNGEVKLEKQADGSWKDPKTNEVYEVVDGKIKVKTPNGEKLTVGDIVTAQGKDSTGTLADSSKVNKSVSPYDGSKPSSTPIYRKTGQTKVTDEQVKENLNYNDKDWKLDSVSVPNYDRDNPGTSFAIAIFTSLKDGSTIVVPVDIIVTGEPIGPSIIYSVEYRDCPKSEKKPSSEKEKEEEKPAPSSEIKENKPYIIGLADDTFRPEAGITRGEVATIFARLKNNMENMTMEGHDTKYPDVLKSDWYSGYIHFLSTYDIMNGFPDGTYRPKQVITRAEFAAIIARYMGLEPSDTHFADAIGNWAAGYIGAANKAGYITGYPDGTYKPQQPISRAEAVTIINRMIMRQADLNYIDLNHDKLRLYTDVPRNHWAYGDIYAASIHHWYRDGLKTDQWIETEYNKKN